MHLRLFTSFVFSILATLSYSQCLISDFNVNIGPCSGADLYAINGTVTFSNAPTTGTLNITVNDGITIYDTIINAPFSSPESFSLSNLPANNQSIEIAAVFSDSPSCSLSLISNAPEPCTCSVSAGTFNAEIIGNSIVPTILTWEDQLNITSNNDYIFFNEYSAISGYDPGMYYLMYKCPPNTADIAPNDPCLLAIAGADVDFSDVNNASSAFYSVIDQLTDNIIYYVPVPAYSLSNAIVAISIDASPWCYDYGEVFAMQYLDSIAAPYTMDGIAGTVDFTVSGALPVLNGSNFTLSELSPATASLTTTTVANAGTFSITDLNAGETFSVKITDDAGSTKIISNQLLGIDENNLAEIEVYPNPFNATIEISGVTQSLDYQLMDINGKIVANGKLTAGEKIQTSQFKSGFYILELTAGASKKHIKLLKN